jgi:hypothetical protein
MADQSNVVSETLRLLAGMEAIHLQATTVEVTADSVKLGNISELYLKPMLEPGSESEADGLGE